MSISWTATEVEKTLNTKTVTDADGKKHIRRDKTMKVPYEYPIINPTTVTEPLGVAEAIQEILDAKRPGFMTLRAVVEHLNFGLYGSARTAIARGADVRYTQAQRSAIKMFAEMVKAGLLERQVAVEGLLRQGVSDAEAAIDALAEEPEATEGEAQA